VYARLALAVAFALFAAVAPRTARAWEEAHQTGGDFRVRIEANGAADVRLALRWHVVRGPLKWIDLADVDAAATLDPQVAVASEDGRATTAHAVRQGERVVRILFDEPRALSRGRFAFDVHWRVNLREARGPCPAEGRDPAMCRALRFDGANWLLAWSSPATSDGLDGARTVFDVPAAPDPPRPIAPETGVVDSGALATVRREADRDVLELVRPHVARGEAVRWTLRLDPRAFARPADAPATVSWEPAGPEPDPSDYFLVGPAALFVGLTYGLLVRSKARAFRALCLEHGARLRGLVPLPEGARPAMAGALLASAVGLESARQTTAGAVCVALAILAATLRAPAGRPSVRGPGRWSRVPPALAFRVTPAAGHWLDLDAARGRAVAVASAALIPLMVWMLRHFDGEVARLAGLDATALVPLFLTGRASQLPPHGARSTARWMKQTYRRLLRLESVCVTPWARITEPATGVADDPARGADELRLMVLPRAPMPGLIGIEIGLAWSSTPVGWTGTPEVLLRVLDASPASAKVVRELPGVRRMPGRRDGEQVMSLLPRAPTRASAVALVQALVNALKDLRQTAPSARPWTAPERRSLGCGPGCGPGSSGERSEGGAA
jgi:hypothetical protein